MFHILIVAVKKKVFFVNKALKLLTPAKIIDLKLNSLKRNTFAAFKVVQDFGVNVQICSVAERLILNGKLSDEKEHPM